MWKLDSDLSALIKDIHFPFCSWKKYVFLKPELRHNLGPSKTSMASEGLVIYFDILSVFQDVDLEWFASILGTKHRKIHV